tara:strand:- start:76 stop:291 length:216 start_codon:yes stop_codon:yes gene_type:complete
MVKKIKKIKKKQVSPSKRKDGKRWHTVALKEETKAMLKELAMFHDSSQGHVLEKLIGEAFEKALKESEAVH